MEIQIVTTEVYRKVHNLQSKSTESHGSKEGKKFCRDMFPRFNEIPEPFALRAREPFRADTRKQVGDSTISSGIHYYQS